MVVGSDSGIVALERHLNKFRNFRGGACHTVGLEEGDLNDPTEAVYIENRGAF